MFVADMTGMLAQVPQFQWYFYSTCISYQDLYELYVHFLIFATKYNWPGLANSIGLMGKLIKLA